MSIASERKAIEATYMDECDIYRFEKVKENGMTSEKPVILYENIPCAMSQKSSRTTHQTDTVNNIRYDAKLFLAPELDIPPGSLITVRRMKLSGRIFRFKSSGEPFIYETHQEIVLLRTDKA